MNLIAEKILKQNGGSRVELVRSEDGTPYIRRVIDRDMRAVYYALRDADSPRVPKVESVELGWDTVIIEQFVDGRTLDELKLTRQFTRDDIISIAEQLLRALIDIGAKSIVHRDIKASNIMIGDSGQLWLIDFGGARIFRPGADRDSSPAGTDGHAAPEQYGAGQSDARSDIYGTGTVMRELCELAGLKRGDALRKFADRCSRFDPIDRFNTPQEALKTLLCIKHRRKRLAVWCAAAALAAAVVTACIMFRWRGAERTLPLLFWMPKAPQPYLEDLTIFSSVVDGKMGRVTDDCCPLNDDVTASAVFEVRGEEFRISLSTPAHPEGRTFVMSDDVIPESVYYGAQPPPLDSLTVAAEILLADTDGCGTREVLVALRHTGELRGTVSGDTIPYVQWGLARFIKYTAERGFEMADGYICTSMMRGVKESANLVLSKVRGESFMRLETSDGLNRYRFIDGVLYWDASRMDGSPPDTVWRPAHGGLVSRPFGKYKGRGI